MSMQVLGGALPSVLEYTKAKRLTDALPSIGNDLIAAYCPFISPNKLPGANIGGLIGRMYPIISRRTQRGTFPFASGRGARLSNSIGAITADTTDGTMDLRAMPNDRAEFGVGVLFYLDEAFFDGVSHPIFGNSESGGATVGHSCSRTGAGGYEGGVVWDNITNLFYGSNPDKFQQARIMEPGWHHVTADRSGGLAGMRVNGKELITNTRLAPLPTLTSINLGSLVSGSPSVGIRYSVALVCDGSLAQSAARQAEWEALVNSVKNDVTL